MKIKCNREKLAALFNLAVSVIPTRSPKPILMNVKLEVFGEKATLTATDLQVGIRADLTDIEIETPGVIALPSKSVAAILRESSDEELTIESDGTSTLIHGAKSRFKLPTVDPAEFPSVPEFGFEAYHELSPKFFKETSRRTAFATDEESSRYALGGVLLEMEEESLTAVGTDGRRLACQKGPAKAVNGHETTASTVIPTRSLHLIERALSDQEETMKIAVDENSVTVQCGSVTIFSRLVEGRFPRWRDVFPDKDGMTEMSMIVGPLLAAARQASILTEREEPGVDYKLGNGVMELKSHGDSLGDSQVELPIPYEGDEVIVRLDPFFMMDFLRLLDLEQTFRFYFLDNETAVLFQTDDQYGYVIMPMVD
jgi:DNA polymerase III subunit beta